MLLGSLVGGFLALAKLGYGALQLRGPQTGIFHDGGGGRIDFEESHKHGLESDVFVALLLGDIKRFLKHIVAVAAQIGLAAAAHLWQRGYLTLQLLIEHGKIGAYLREDKLHERLTFLYHAFQQMNRLNGLVAVALGKLESFLNGFLRFDCEIIKVHKRQINSVSSLLL